MTQRRRDVIRRTATWLALAVSVTLAGAFTWLRATVPSDDARVSFYGDAWSSAGIVIDPIDPPAAGLQVGDLVVAVAERSMGAWLADATDPAVGRPPAGPPIPYSIVRAGSPTTVDVVWAVPSVGATLLAGWSIVVFSVATAAVAAFAYAQRPNVPAATALVLAACGAAGSSVPWFLGTTTSAVVQGPPFILHALLTGPLYMLLWPAALHLALVFPSPSPLVRRHRWLVPAVYAIVLGAYAVAMIAGRLATASDLDWVGTWPTAQVVVILPVVVLALARFVLTARRTRDPEARATIRYAWLGVVWGLTLGLLLFTLPELVAGRPLLPESWIGLAALPVPFAIAAAILRDHLFDIDVVVRRTFVYGTLTLGVVATYVAVAASITAILGPDHGPGVELFATGAAALIALPLRDVLQRGVNRLLYGERDEPWRAIRRLGQRLDLAMDPARAFPVIAETVAGALRTPYVRLEVVDDTGRLVPAAMHGTSSSAMVNVPIEHGTETVGNLVLGIRPGERGFRTDELELVADLARQAGGAINALRLRADLARSHERLLLAREEERRRLRHDLHDGLGPSLAAIGMRAEASAEVLESDPAAARALLDELGTDVQATLADIRRLVEGLRPPALDELGLIGAIAQQARRLEGPVAGERSIRITVEGSPQPLPTLPAAIEVAAYRIAVEALTNAVRHAGAQSCSVSITVANSLEIEVVDDGHGLPPRLAPGTGLESMEARAVEIGGSLRLDHRPGGGTRLEARLPLVPGSAASVGLPGEAGEPATDATEAASP